MTLPPVTHEPEYLRLVSESPLVPHVAGQRAIRFLTIEEVCAIPAPDFLIEEILPVGALAELHGPPGGGKTFVAIDLALSVASGRPFFGRTVRRGRVVYVIAEGQSGIGVRYRAWMDARGATVGIDLQTVPEAIQLLESGHVAPFIAAMSDRPPALIVLDTLARCFLGGEENSARDMGMLVAGADRIRQATGACVLLVHHTRKDGDVERGSVALRGGVDTMLSLKDEDDHLLLSCEKQKDAAPFAPIPLRLKPQAESLVVAPLDEARTGPSAKAIALLDVLVRDFPGDGATTTEWCDASGTPWTSFYRARGELVREHLVAQQKQGNATRFRATPDGLAELSNGRLSTTGTKPSTKLSTKTLRDVTAGGWNPLLGGFHPPSPTQVPPSVKPPTTPCTNGTNEIPTGTNEVPKKQGEIWDSETDEDVRARIDERKGMREEEP